ncbi:TA system VapC family ribonuclease toxin [Solicola gregarius]|uniref:Ribonuclease VapC n=1 Tax=Solicola gregarius TaxID=2908642 RepID=A0AA46YLN9_9ACTN|nr:TA system VapC family ribonuclease toxin [Solicola gregarius]UYM05053.1 PIN domain-containing protein [Solicola gregarius]
MKRALLDVNVLLALLDSDHVEHHRARSWLTAEVDAGWASCAITQNGFVRIVSHPRYPKPISPREALDRLAAAAATDHHAFWTCSTSILDPAAVDRTRLHGPRQVTDAYLLAVATANGGRFVTFDRAIPAGAVPNAADDALVVL